MKTALRDVVENNMSGSKIEIKELDDESLDKYDELVDISLEGTIFHKAWWLRLMNPSCEFHGVFENGNLIAAIPIPTSNIHGLKFVHHPWLTPYLGPIFGSEYISNDIKLSSWKKKINSKFAKLLKSNRVCFQYIFNRMAIDLQPYIWENFDIYVSYTYILKLNNLNGIFDNMDKKRKYDIRKNYKANYKLTKGEIEKYIILNAQTMKRQGMKTLDMAIWTKLFKECKNRNHCEIFTAYKDDQPVASLFLVWDNKRGYYLGGGASNDAQGMMSLLVWEAITYTKNVLNLNEFDFEGSNIPGIEFYFRKFGGELSPFFYISENSIKKYVIVNTYRKIKSYLGLAPG